MRTIAWDVDDVLNDLARCWLEQAWRRAHPQCDLPYEALTRNPPHRELGVDMQAYLDSLDGYRHTQGYLEMVPTPAVLEWFQAHGGGCYSTYWC